MHRFGEKVGIAFQIKDDLFDFGIDDVGKPLGNDIKEKKLTLPLIHALKQVNKPEKRRIINLVKNHNDDPQKVNEVIAFVKANGGMEYATSQMLAYQQKAFDILTDFQANEHRHGLEQLVRYTTERNK